MIWHRFVYSIRDKILAMREIRSGSGRTYLPPIAARDKKRGSPAYRDTEGCSDSSETPPLFSCGNEVYQNPCSNPNETSHLSAY